MFSSGDGYLEDVKQVALNERQNASGHCEQIKKLAFFLETRSPSILHKEQTSFAHGAREAGLQDELEDQWARNTRYWPEAEDEG